MLGFRKYKLLPVRPVKVDDQVTFLHRIVATKDIPKYNVKKGDFGGLVSSKYTLSHKGNCWIQIHAIVAHHDPEKSLSPVYSAITGDVVIADTACLIDSEVHHDGTAVIGGSSFIKRSSLIHEATSNAASAVMGSVRIVDSMIHGQIIMSDNASIESSSINAKENTVKLANNASISHSEMVGGVTLLDDAHITDSAVDNNLHASGGSKIAFSEIGGAGTVAIKDHAMISHAVLSPASGAVVYVTDFAQIIGSVGNKSIVYPLEGQTVALKGNAKVIESKVSGTLGAKDDVHILRSTILGINHLSGKVQVKAGAVLQGENYLSGDTVVQKRSLNGDSTPNVSLPVSDAVLDASPQESTAGLPEFPDSKYFKPHITAINETLADYDSYTTDIVKLLKYPAMADGTIPEIQALIVAARKARREIKEPSSLESLKAVADALEFSFAAAESKALTIATSHLDKKAQESLRDASQRFAIACDTGATDNERKLGFKAGMKSLEGIIHIPSDAVDAFKAKTGLLAIDA